MGDHKEPVAYDYSQSPSERGKARYVTSRTLEWQEW